MKLLHGDDRAEDLVLDRLVVLLQVRDDGRLARSKPRSPCRAPPASTRAWSGSRLEHAADPVELVGVVQRAVQDVRRRSGAPILVLRACSASASAKSSAIAGRDQHAGGGGAVLAGVEVAADRDVLGRVLDVGVVEDDDRRLAAEFEVRALEVLRRGLGHLVAGAGRAGDRHHRRGLVRDDGPAGVAVAADHVEDAGREELGGDLGHQHGGHRRGVATA